MDAQLSLGDEVMGCLRRAGVFRAMVPRELAVTSCRHPTFFAWSSDRYGGWVNWLDR